MRLECGLLSNDIAAASPTKKVVIAGIESDGVVASDKLVSVLAEESLLAGEEVVGRGFAARGPDIGLGCAPS